MPIVRRRKPSESDKTSTSAPSDDDISGGGTTTGKEDDDEDSKRKNKKRRKKKPAADKPPLLPPPPGRDEEEEGGDEGKRGKRRKTQATKWSCVDSCCWFVGCVCLTWWVLLFPYNAMPASFPQYVTEAITGPSPDPPRVKLKKEGLRSKHLVVFVPGIVTAGLELWEGHHCADGLFQKRLWGGTFGEVYKRPLCWVEHMSLDNETGLDPSGIRVRPVSGLVAADYFAPGYFVWAVLIANLARIGYEENSMYTASYDWRLSFQNTEVRDRTLSRIESNIELMVSTNDGNKAVIIPHSMGVSYSLHFMKWVEAPAPMGGGGGPDWCSKHIKAVMNIGGPFLGVPKAVAGLFSAEARDIAVVSRNEETSRHNAGQPPTLPSITASLRVRRRRPFPSPSIIAAAAPSCSFHGVAPSLYPPSLPPSSLRPKPNSRRRSGSKSLPSQLVVVDPSSLSPLPSQLVVVDPSSLLSADSSLLSANSPKSGIISFGKDVAEAPSLEIDRIDFRDALKGQTVANTTCRDVWTEYHDMGLGGIKAVAEYKSYTVGSVVDLLRFVAPKMMDRGSFHFSYGIADNLDDPKYNHFKYWSNPLETKLPNALDMEIFSLYGVGIPTERAYVYRLSPAGERYISF
ncbi:Phospholipid:diacylglycerol acyltransferase 1 [Linum perenne]